MALIVITVGSDVGHVSVEGHVKCEGHPLSGLNISLVNVRFEDETVLLASTLTNEEGRYKVSTGFEWTSSPIVHLRFGYECGKSQGKELLEDYYIPTDDLYWSDDQSGAFLYDVDLGGVQPKRRFVPLDN
ncbi:hypothetical protein AAVH_37191 [Aphelenchoides avenae]|nr:hypothetical protein AAVH_37191 [Aphelenchus avenae]